MNKQHEAYWQRIGINESRLIVPGGWLVKCFNSSYSPSGGGPGYVTQIKESMRIIFVPDPKHNWVISREETGEYPNVEEKFYYSFVDREIESEDE